MQLVICSDEDLKKELMATGTQTSVDVIWINDTTDFQRYLQADVFIDLLFENNQGSMALLEKLLPKAVIINSVTATLSQTDADFIRINAWPTFLESTLIEGSCLNKKGRTTAEQAFNIFNKQLQWLPDELGFVTPRVVSAIINEAYFALSEGVSSKEEIDIAMQLGTNYPYGPFAWSEKIGLKNIVALLKKLSLSQTRYAPCELLLQEAGTTL